MLQWQRCSGVGIKLNNNGTLQKKVWEDIDSLDKLFYKVMPKCSKPNQDPQLSFFLIISGDKMLYKHSSR